MDRAHNVIYPKSDIFSECIFFLLYIANMSVKSIVADIFENAELNVHNYIRFSHLQVKSSAYSAITHVFRHFEDVISCFATEGTVEPLSFAVCSTLASHFYQLIGKPRGEPSASLHCKSVKELNDVIDEYVWINVLQDCTPLISEHIKRFMSPTQMPARAPASPLAVYDISSDDEE